MVGPNVVFTVAIRWGRVGSLGSRQVKTFYSSSSMLSWIEKMVWSKKEKGYVEQQRAGAGAPKGSQQSAPPPKAKRPRREPTGKARASKKTYKIYGSKRGKPIHTRVGGRVYIPTGQSKFSKGDNPEVVVGSDGRASVIDPQTGHTQYWDGFDEVKTWVNDLVIEALVTKFNSVLSS